MVLLNVSKGRKQRNTANRDVMQRRRISDAWHGLYNRSWVLSVFQLVWSSFSLCFVRLSACFEFVQRREGASKQSVNSF